MPNKSIATRRLQDVFLVIFRHLPTLPFIRKGLATYRPPHRTIHLPFDRRSLTDSRSPPCPQTALDPPLPHASPQLLHVDLKKKKHRSDEDTALIARPHPSTHDFRRINNQYSLRNKHYRLQTEPTSTSKRYEENECPLAMGSSGVLCSC